MSRERGGQWSAMIASTVLFAASYSLTKVALADIAPFTLGLLRFAVAGLVLLAARLGGRAPRQAELRRLALAGFLGVTAYFALENLGVQLATATDASLLVAAYPAIATALDAAVRRRRPSLRTLLSLVLTGAGVVLVVAGPGPGRSGQGAHQLWGDLLLMGSGLAWAGYTLVSRELGNRRPALQTVAWQDTAGAVMFLPLAALEAPTWHLPHHPVATGLSVCVLVVGCSIAAMALYNHALTALSTSAAVNTLNLVPVWGVLIAVLFIGERLRLLQVLGALVVITGVSLTDRKDTP